MRSTKDFCRQPEGAIMAWGVTLFGATSVARRQSSANSVSTAKERDLSRFFGIQAVA